MRKKRRTYCSDVVRIEDGEERANREEVVVLVQGHLDDGALLAKTTRARERKRSLAGRDVWRGDDPHERRCKI